MHRVIGGVCGIGSGTVAANVFFSGMFMKFAGPSYTFDGVENGASVEAIGGTCTDEFLPAGHSRRSLGSLNSSSLGLSRTRSHTLETLDIPQSSL